MTGRGKFLLTLLIVGIGGIGAYKWTSRLTPASSPSTSAPVEQPSSTQAPAGFRSAKLTLVRGYVGGEKMGLVQNPRLRTLLAEKYGIDLRADRRGSVEMVTTEPLEGIDFIWPGSQSQSDLFRRSNRARKAEEVLFVSPIVIYSWDLVQAALAKEGIVATRDSTHYIVDLPKFLDAVVQRRKWRDLGIPELFGSVKVAFTDPAKSNSGGQYLVLAGTILSGDDNLGPEHLAKVSPQLRRMIESLGYVQASSGDLFDQYVKQGMGAFPLVAAYENQIIEFALANPEFAEQIRQKLRILYPQPTIWSNHPMIALTDQGRRLLEAMKSTEIQALAWKEHGLRNERASIDPRATAGFTGIPASLTAVISSPSLEVMDRLLAGVQPPHP